MVVEGADGEVELQGSNSAMLLAQLVGDPGAPPDPLQMGMGQRPGACIIMNILNNSYVLSGIPL